MTFIEPPVKQLPVEQPHSNQKHIKRMKKKLGKLNRKIRYSNQKHNNLVHKRNSLKKKIEELKGACEPEGPHEPKESFNPIELKQAFNGAYRSYRINGVPRMDPDTFFERIRQNRINLIRRELQDLGSARAETTTWIRYVQELTGIEIDRVDRVFNSRMTEVH